MAINENAPITARGEVDVGADQQTVWELLSDVEGWPRWSRDVAWAKLKGPLLPGTEFEWKAGPSTITSQLVTVDPPSTLAWTGSTMGIRAVHAWHVERRGDRTYVITEESWDGLLPRLLRGPLRRRLERSIDEGLAHLKADLEKGTSR